MFAMLSTGAGLRPIPGLRGKHRGVSPSGSCDGPRPARNTVSQPHSLATATMEKLVLAWSACEVRQLQTACLGLTPSCSGWDGKNTLAGHEPVEK